MEKGPQNPSSDSSGTFLLILASVAVLLLVGFMVVTVLWPAPRPRTVVYAPREAPAGGERTLDAPQSPMESSPAR